MLPFSLFRLNAPFDKWKIPLFFRLLLSPSKKIIPLETAISLIQKIRCGSHCASPVWAVKFRNSFICSVVY